LQAEGEHTRARDVLSQAPFLVPFKDRVRIFTVFKILRTSKTTCSSIIGDWRSIKIVNVQEAFQIISFYPLFYLLVVVITMSCVMFCGSVQSHIAAARAESGPHNHMGRIRIKIRRDHITEDAFSQLNDVSADALKGTVMNLTSLDSGYLVDATSRMFL
jgi:hypothetical protein